MKDSRSKKAIAASLSLTLTLGSVPAVALADENQDANEDGGVSTQSAFQSLMFSANGGSFSTGGDVVTINADADGSFSAPAAPTRSGYTFVGWYGIRSTAGYPDSYVDMCKFDGTNPTFRTYYALWEEADEPTQKASYNVDYDANGGVFADGNSMQYGTTDDNGVMRQPASPTRDGYTFLGWYWCDSQDGLTDEQLASKKVDFDQPIAEDETVYALWQKESEETPSEAEYNVLYVANGGQFADGQDTQQGVTDSDGIMRQPAAPTRDGYTFDGWYWHADLSQMTDEQKQAEKVDFSQPVQRDVTIYAQWTKNEEQKETNVLYVANGGQFADGQDTQQGVTDSDGIMRQPAAPTRDGYTFDGWYWHADLSQMTDEQKQAEKVDFSQPVQRDVTIYAQWTKNEEQKETNVLYVANGGQFADGQDTQQGVTDSDGIMRQPAAPTRDGYTFDGWYWHADLSQMTDEQKQAEKVDFSQPVQRDVTIYAQWTKNEEQKETNVLYVANGGQFADGQDTQQGVTDSDGIMRQPAAPTRDGYTFDGWYWHADLSQMTDEQKQAEKVDFSQPVQRDVTIYAQWTKNEEQKETNVLYVANGGQFADGQDTQQGVTDSDGIMRQPAAPTRDGYTFDGWYWHADLSQMTDEQKQAEKVDFSQPVQRDVTIYAQWTKNEEQKETNVLYVANGGQFADGQDTQQGVTDSDGIMRQPAAPTRDGYTFDGWYWHADLSQMTDEQKQAEKVDFSQPVQRDVTIYAQWTKNEEQKETNVLYVANGGQFADGQDTQQGVTDSDGIMRQPAAPTRDGYTFDGWYWHADLSQMTDEQKQAEKVDFSQPVQRDVTIYAQWKKSETPAEKVTVKFVDNFNKTTSSQEIEKGATATQPADPAYDGYTFEGWSSTLEDEQGNPKYTKVDFSQPVNEDTTYYAFYVKNATPQPGDNGNQGATTDNTEATTAADNQATGEQEGTDQSSEAPQTSDATNAAAVAGIGGIAGLLAAAAALLRRRRNN